MKANTMYRIAVIAAVLATGAYAQTDGNERPYFSDIVTIQQTDYSKLEKRYAACLGSENEGVVESALAHITMFKLMYPVKDFDVLNMAVKDVAVKHPSREIRYRATIVLSLFENPRMYASAACGGYTSPDELFDALAAKTHNAIVSNEAK